MIQITNKNKCCGCEACVQVCPKHCISFTQDYEGFFYPETDVDICIKCGLCEKVCPVLYPYDVHTPQEVLAAINKDEEVRMESSSGGVFTLLAEEIISQGGVVFGVRFDNHWQAVFDCAETTEKLAAFRGSKYIQARVGNSFAQCKQFLDLGKIVLFSGTQCQIAGLLHFLRKPYPNLLTIDFICHGVPSPKVWQHYITGIVQDGGNNIRNVRFRDKRLGWKRYSVSLDYNKQNNTYSLSSVFLKNVFMQAFLSNLILRPSCHACPAKGGRSQSDLTIADFWGINQVNPQMDDDKGTSLVMIHTEKGNNALQRDKLMWASANYNDVLRYNPSVEKSPICHPNRMKFFSALDKQTDIQKQICNCLRPPLIKRMFFAVKQLFRLFKQIMSKL